MARTKVRTKVKITNMKKSIIFASTLVLSVGFSSVVYSNKASSAASTQTLAVATKLPFSAGSVLNKGMKLTSPSGNHILVVGTDGNLVVITKNGGYVWGLDLVLPNLGQARPERLELRADGSFGAYNDKGVAVWLAPGRGL